jgi:hypothetical protein
MFQLAFNFPRYKWLQREIARLHQQNASTMLLLQNQSDAQL